MDAWKHFINDDNKLERMAGNILSGDLKYNIITQFIEYID